MAGDTVTVSVGRHQLAATVFGAGMPAVVIEPSFGGAAEDWEKVAQTLGQETTVVTYDRAPYGASSAAQDRRTPHDIAADLDGLLTGLGVTGPLILVGHSAGGSTCAPTRPGTWTGSPAWSLSSPATKPSARSSTRCGPSGPGCGWP